MVRYSLSALKSLVATHHSEPFWVGIDVHKRSYHLALLRSGTKTFTLVAPACPDKLLEQLRNLDILVAGVVYKAGPTGFSLARTLQTEEFPIIVAAPSKVPKSLTAGAKTDRLDCIKLAHFASKGLIRPIVMPTEQEESHRSLSRRRHQLVDSIRQCKQRIKGFLLYHGFEETKFIKNWSSNYEEQIAALPLETEGRLTIESHLRELTFIENELRSVIDQLEQIE